MDLLFDFLLDELLVLFLGIHSVTFHATTSTLLFWSFVYGRQAWMFLCRTWSIIWFFLLGFLCLFDFLFFLWLNSRVIRNRRRLRRKHFFLRHCALDLHGWLFLVISSFDILQRLNLLYMFLRKLVLNVILLTPLLIHIVEHLMHLWIVLKSVCVSQSVETMVSWGRAGRNAGYHHDFWLVLFGYEGITKNQC